MSKKSSLVGQTAIVTGAGGDIGRAMVQRLHARGAFVVAVDRDSRALDKLLGRSDNTDLLALEGNVSDEESVRAFIDRALSETGRIDILCNNAGIEGPVAPISDYPLVDFERVVEVNVVGVFLGMKHVIHCMAAQGRGSIINMASTAGLAGGPNLSAYVASKHAVIGLTRAAAAECAKLGICVNGIAPGRVAGRMIASILAGQTPENRETRAGGAAAPERDNSPYEVAELAASLASGEAGYANGVIYRIDGGIVSEHV
tara:strand:- start:1239 stop:2012 length:774 start_codon:yes stop_codon:yes gene_type:complete